MRNAHVLVTVYTLLKKEDQILVIRRFNTSFANGKYSLPAGHQDPGESPMQTAIREAKEEVGVDIQEKDLNLVQTIYRKDGNKDRLHLFFQTQKWQGEPSNQEPDKCDLVEWRSLDNLPENLLPYINQAIQKSNQDIPYSEYYLPVE